MTKIETPVFSFNLVIDDCDEPMHEVQCVPSTPPPSPADPTNALFISGADAARRLVPGATDNSELAFALNAMRGEEREKRLDQLSSIIVPGCRQKDATRLLQVLNRATNDGHRRALCDATIKIGGDAVLPHERAMQLEALASAPHNELQGIVDSAVTLTSVLSSLNRPEIIKTLLRLPVSERLDVAANTAKLSEGLFATWHVATLMDTVGSFDAHRRPTFVQLARQLVACAKYSDTALRQTIELAEVPIEQQKDVVDLAAPLSGQRDIGAGLVTYLASAGESARPAVQAAAQLPFSGDAMAALVAALAHVAQRTGKADGLTNFMPHAVQMAQMIPDSTDPVIALAQVSDPAAFMKATRICIDEVGKNHADLAVALKDVGTVIENAMTSCKRFACCRNKRVHRRV